MKPICIGLLGFGTVGRGTWSVLLKNRDVIARRAGREFHIKSVLVNDLNKKRETTEVNFTNDPSTIVDDPEIDIVVELIGGQYPAFDYIHRALVNGKHIVTANKELLAVHGNELFAIARNTGKVIAFEAAVGGGIPVVKAVREGLAANCIDGLVGIINGTSNFILTGMAELRCSFHEMLDKAQRQGYAEADPTFDIEGIDALHKLNILAAIAFGIPLQKLDLIHCEGIEKITDSDIVYADELGFSIKPLAIARKNKSGVEMRVHPALVPKRRLLANVNGVMNGIVVTGNAVGRSLYYGAGAGAEPTASAVIADLIDIARTLDGHFKLAVPQLSFHSEHLRDLPIVPFQQTESANYLRMNALNQPGVLAEVTRILGEHEISIESILQKSSEPHQEILPVVILTQVTREANMQNAQQELAALPTVIGDINRLRIESLA